MYCELRQRGSQMRLRDARLQHAAGFALVAAFTQWIAIVRMCVLALSFSLLCEMPGSVHVALHLARLGLQLERSHATHGEREAKQQDE